VKSAAPAEFFRRESRRHLEVIAERFDVGAWQESNRSIDWNRTFREARAAHERGLQREAEEIEFWRSRSVGLVVSDVPPLPLQFAKTAGLPSALVANFTWLDIYRSHAAAYPGGRELLLEYRSAYRCADVAFSPGLAFPMDYVPNRIDVGLIARRGTNIRSRLREHLGISAKQKLVLLYFGNLGDADLDLSRAASDEITYLSFTDLRPLAHQLNSAHWHFPDVVGSVDAVLAKPGYGTIGECMTNGTPVVYYPRPEFAEYPVIRDALRVWGGAVQISTRDLLHGRWESSLTAAMALSPDRVPAKGAAEIARKLESMLLRSCH
jgi:hypothetical protein